LQGGTLRNITVTSGHDFHLRKCTKCGLVSRSSDRGCASCGGERKNIELLDVLPEYAAVHGTHVEFVTDEAGQMLAKVGGAAGWIRQPKKAAAR
jgi:peptide subunit release factor 1 (eRF1)